MNIRVIDANKSNQNMAFTSRAVFPRFSLAKTTRITDAEAPGNKQDGFSRGILSSSADFIIYQDSAVRPIGTGHVAEGQIVVDVYARGVFTARSVPAFDPVDSAVKGIFKTAIDGRYVTDGLSRAIFTSRTQGNSFVDVTSRGVFSSQDSSILRLYVDSESKGVFRTRLEGAFSDTQQVFVLSERGEITEYTQFPMASMARAGNQWYGINDQAFYTLGGDTDDTLPILGRIRTGLSDNQDPGLKRPRDIIIDGEVLTRFIAKYLEATHTGVNEHWYLTEEQLSQGISEHYAKIGRGSLSKYFGIEIVNQDGGNFQIDAIVVHYLDTIRRRGRR